MNCPTDEVDHAFRGILDLGSHRLDAWITSMATRRLEEQRARTPVGIYIGAYGFVHDLKPDTVPDSEGYIHVPSPTHAVTAAVLRAEHIANRADNPDAYAIRLISERVRNALYLSEGMAEGRELVRSQVTASSVLIEPVVEAEKARDVFPAIAAQAGPDFERALVLHDAASAIPTFREKFPLMFSEQADPLRDPARNSIPFSRYRPCD